MAKEKPKKNKGGRPSSFKPEYVEQAYKLSLLGAKDTEMANFFEVSEKTLNNWKQDHPKFLQSLKEGKEVADARVVDSLYKKAIGGHKIRETTFEKVVMPSTSDEDIAQEVYKKKVVEKEVVADTTAQIFWLKNRQPDKWREKPQEADEYANINKNLEALTNSINESKKVYDGNIQQETT